jgi:outer membrane immunogenic protein
MKVIATLAGLAALTLTALGGPEPLPESKESKAVVAPERPIYNWTGFYIGINGGYAWDLTADVSDLDFLNVGPPVGSWSVDADGPVGGAQIGYNWHAWQISKDPLALIIGVEGDGGYFGVYGHSRQPGSLGAGTFAKVNPGAYATARGRVGLAWDRWLFYATGGWIGSNYERKVVDNEICQCGTVLGSGEDEDWRSGWTVGGGIEWAFRPQHWTMKIEYLYYDFDDTVVDVHIFRSGIFRFGWDDNTGNLIRAGLNYRF